MTGHVLIDINGNVLVYAADASEREKHEKLRPPLSRAEAHRRVALTPSFDLAALLA